MYKVDFRCVLWRMLKLLPYYSFPITLSLLFLPYYAFPITPPLLPLSYYSFRTTPSLPLLLYACVFTNINFSSLPLLLHHCFSITTSLALLLHHFVSITTSSPLLHYYKAHCFYTGDLLSLPQFRRFGVTVRISYSRQHARLNLPMVLHPNETYPKADLQGRDLLIKEAYCYAMVKVDPRDVIERFK